MLVEICLPVKDEEKILADNLRHILEFCLQADSGFEWKVVGIINGSTDRTAEIFSDFKKEYPLLVDYIEIKSAGKGLALKTYWSQSPADILCYLDIDLAVLPDQLPGLIQPIIDSEADMVIGSRLMAGARTNRSLLREITSRSFNIFARLLLPGSVSDSQCGFKAIRAEAYRKISPYLKDDHWLFDLELIVLSRYFSYRLKEMPVDWDENRYQKRKSKVSVVRDLGKFLKGVIRLRFRLFFIGRHNHKGS